MNSVMSPYGWRRLCVGRHFCSGAGFVGARFFRCRCFVWVGVFGAGFCFGAVIFVGRFLFVGAFCLLGPFWFGSFFLLVFAIHPSTNRSTERFVCWRFVLERFFGGASFFAVIISYLGRGPGPE